MISGSTTHTFHAHMKNMTLGPAKHEKVARIGRKATMFPRFLSPNALV